jgi:hypothetical protein
MSEADIQVAIVAELRARGIPHSVTNAALSYNGKGQIVRRIDPGWPDITACWHGLLLAIECKSARGKLRPEQAQTLHRLHLDGALIVVARSVEDVLEVMNDVANRRKDLEEIAKALEKQK